MKIVLGFTALLLLISLIQGKEISDSGFLPTAGETTVDGMPHLSIEAFPLP